MVLKSCKKCGGQVDSSTETCPHCGAKLKQSFGQAVCGCVCGLIVLICLMMFI